MIGKAIRMERIMDRESGNMVIVPMDHGVSEGPIPGLENLVAAVEDVSKGGADAVLMHKGMVGKGHRGYGSDIGLMIHLNAGSSIQPDPNNKILVTRVEEAIFLGADAVSIHVNVGADKEHRMLADLGSVAQKCNQFGIPLLAMMYPRGPQIQKGSEMKYVKHVARLGAELGADIVKTLYTGNPKTFAEVVEGCPVPVVIAGGPKVESEQDLFNMVADAMDCGARGISIGRNVFGAVDRIDVTKKLCKIVHKKR